jgi:hypothetical protein
LSNRILAYGLNRKADVKSPLGFIVIGQLEVDEFLKPLAFKEREDFIQCFYNGKGSRGQGLESCLRWDLILGPSSDPDLSG